MLITDGPPITKHYREIVYTLPTGDRTGFQLDPEAGDNILHADPWDIITLQGREVHVNLAHVAMRSMHRYTLEYPPQKLTPETMNINADQAQDTSAPPAKATYGGH